MKVFKKRLYHKCVEEHLFGSDIVGGRLFLPLGTLKLMASQELVIEGGVVVT